jgi:hypothetical protein
MNVETLVDHVLKDADDLNVLVGPLSKRGYFIVVTGERGEFRSDQIVVKSGDDRQAFIAAQIAKRPIVVSDLDCELKMARFCEALWPSERSVALRKNIEEEFGEAGR